jgi:hypothetical protein
VDSNGRRSHAEKRTLAIVTPIISKEDTGTDHHDATTVAVTVLMTFAIGMALRHEEVGMMRRILVATEEAGTTIDRDKIAITPATETTILVLTTIAGIDSRTANRHETRSDLTRTRRTLRRGRSKRRKARSPWLHHNHRQVSP